MGKPFVTPWAMALLMLMGCVHHTHRLQAQPDDHVAFPGAMGFGKMATGGRGGKVWVVQSLEDSGPGSLREAAESKGPRIIVFAVAGTIHLQSPLRIRGDVTIAGQSAPGLGICLADQPVQIAGDNVVLRYLRIRMGDRFQSQMGKQPGSGHDDALSVNKRKHIIIDHCSFSWSTDEVLSIYGGDSSTVQWCIISEPLNYSYHFETGDTDYEQHGYGGIWGGAHLTAHHNLFAHCISRTPRFNGTRLGANTEMVDFYNNAIYHWKGNNVYGGEGGRYQVHHNYYKPGPGTSAKVMDRLVNPTRNQDVGFGQYYVAGNKMDGNDALTRNNKKGIHIGDGKFSFSADSIILQSAFLPPSEGLTAAEDAWKAIMAKGGASHHRDSLDARIIWNVVKGNGRFIDVQGGFAHGTAYAQTTQAWPVILPAAAPADADADGMPDDWERQHGLNPKDAADAAKHDLHTHYTNVEVYLNNLVKGS